MKSEEFDKLFDEGKGVTRQSIIKIWLNGWEAWGQSKVPEWLLWHFTLTPFPFC